MAFLQKFFYIIKPASHYESEDRVMHEDHHDPETEGVVDMNMEARL